MYIYFGDNLFHKLDTFAIQNSASTLYSQKTKIFCAIDASSDLVLEDIFLGWSYVIYRTGSSYNHVGYLNSKNNSAEVFSDYHNSDLKVACGANEVFAASNDGKLYHYSTQKSNGTFCTVKNLHKRVQSLATGDNICVILLDDGSVSLLNLNEDPPLIQFPLQSFIIEVACGKEHSIFLSKSGQVFSYGCGSRGQLGHGTIENQENPLLLEALDGIHIKTIACGGWHSAAVSDSGDLYMWGWNESGQLGFPCAELHSNLPLNEIETVCCIPKVVDLEVEKQILSVSCGTRHTVVMTEDFEIWTWGWNEYGQLGYDKYPLSDKPCKIQLPSNFIPKNVKCAFWSTLISGILTV